ncbi:L-threonylcarbamoyladenylate synthase [Criblamydia sequanensis]|uniref:Threonylcarbamoyl-AMP synthase n=1 Tax=Candidatus Criblamydia sequanensis CRIB-18 TaxID=1437425 RepID=A0A090CZK1_9BACT|nr:L-threonylcarbamoyladenylate synthase [Criblamydia sequanensis]CDR34557.1 Sua5/YciO/YrdC/YwlC family protein [Criblamydia sequanensis CRIB-18]
MRIPVSLAIELLNNEKVVGLPTETVYGLAAKASSDEAIKKIFEFKKRPLDNPLILHVSSIDEVKRYLIKDENTFYDLAKAFWPGPLTLVMPVIDKLISPLVRANLPTAAFRMPCHPIPVEIIRSLGPIVMPSANLSGKPSATSYEDVEEDFGEDFPVVDGGRTLKGIESTILVLKEGVWELGRRGSLSLESIEKVLGYSPKPASDKKLVCPGQKYRHYAPKASLILSEKRPDSKIEAVLGFKDKTYPDDLNPLYLSDLNSPAEASKNLYHLLRLLDRRGYQSVWVDMDMPKGGLWDTLRERIQKASS